MMYTRKLLLKSCRILKIRKLTSSRCTRCRCNTLALSCGLTSMIFSFFTRSNCLCLRSAYISSLGPISLLLHCWGNFLSLPCLLQQPQKNSSISQESLFELHEQQKYLRQMYQQPLYSQQLMQQQQLFHRQQLMQQFPAYQMSQPHLMTDANDLTMRQQIGMQTGVLQQQQSVGQRVGSLHPHLMSGVSSPQLHRALSPQSNLTNLQHNSLSGVSTNSLSGISTVSNSPQHMINRVQPGSSFDLGQITMQELATGCLQQQQSVGRRVGSLHPQLKSGISSPQLHRALSPQYLSMLRWGMQVELIGRKRFTKRSSL